MKPCFKGTWFTLIASREQPGMGTPGARAPSNMLPVCSVDATVERGQSLWYSTNARTFGPWSPYRAGGTADVHACRGKQFFVKVFYLLPQSATIVVLTYMFVLDQRNILWLRDTVRRTPLGKPIVFWKIMGSCDKDMNIRCQCREINKWQPYAHRW